MAHYDVATASWGLDLGHPTFSYLSVIVQKKVDFPFKGSGLIVALKFNSFSLAALPVPYLALYSVLLHT